MYKNPQNESIKNTIRNMNESYINHSNQIGNTLSGISGGCKACDSDSDEGYGVKKYKKQSVNKMACGGSGFAKGTFMDSGFGSVKGAGKKGRKMKGGAILANNSDGGKEVLTKGLFMEDEDMHIQIDTFFNKILVEGDYNIIPSTIKNLYLYVSQKKKAPYSMYANFVGDKLDKVKYPYGLTIYIVSYNESWEDGEPTMSNIQVKHTFNEEEFLNFYKPKGAGKPKRTRKVKTDIKQLVGLGQPEQKMVERSVMQGSTFSGGKKAIKKQSKKEGGKKEPTEWMKLVEKTKEEHPELKLKEVLQYIKTHNLYKKQ